MLIHDPHSRPWWELTGFNLLEEHERALIGRLADGVLLSSLDLTRWNVSVLVETSSDSELVDILIETTLTRPIFMRRQQAEM